MSYFEVLFGILAASSSEDFSRLRLQEHVNKELATHFLRNKT
jgi:hypothetical protein